MDLTGQRFGYLTAVEYIGNSRWRVKCDCGNETVVRIDNLKTGNTTSCGCFHIRENRKPKKHGDYKAPLYGIYREMIQRCVNSKSKGYHNYGGRGITVCSEWIGDSGYINFKAWSLLNGYKNGLHIDRINNDKGYSPENCRWVTPRVNSRNKRTNKVLEFHGQKMCIAGWADTLHMPPRTLYGRISAGWSIERALTTPRYENKVPQKFKAELKGEK